MQWHLGHSINPCPQTGNILTFFCPQNGHASTTPRRVHSACASLSPSRARRSRFFTFVHLPQRAPRRLAISCVSAGRHLPRTLTLYNRAHSFAAIVLVRHGALLARFRYPSHFCFCRNHAHSPPISAPQLGQKFAKSPSLCLSPQAEHVAQSIPPLQPHGTIHSHLPRTTGRTSAAGAGS